MVSETKSEAEKAAEEWAIYIKCYTGAHEWVDLTNTALNKLAVQAFLAGAAWAAPKWISVKERLPEDSGRYLVCLGGESVQLYYFTPERGFYHTYHSSDMPCTHWQPLPAAPEEEK